MTTFPHDEFVKEYLPELCKDYGIATPSVEVKGETRQIDVLFIPTKEVPTTPETLGLFGFLVQKTCLLEVYRNSVQIQEIRECFSKLLDIQQNEIRKAKRENKQLKEKDLPILWILSPTISERILGEFGALPDPNWQKGVYFLPKAWKTGIIAIHQLPVNRETLWLRILGRGKVQSSAIEELKALPENYTHRENVLELVYGLLANIEANRKKAQKVESQDEVLIMSLRTLFRETLAESKQEGIQEGIQQEALLLVFRMLKRKLGDLAPSIETQLRGLSTQKLEDLSEALLDFNSTQNLIDWLNFNS